jgi:hypothetical protein
MMAAHLVATWAGEKVLVCQVKSLAAQGTNLLLIITVWERGSMGRCSHLFPSLVTHGNI